MVKTSVRLPRHAAAHEVTHARQAGAEQQQTRRLGSLIVICHLLILKVAAGAVVSRDPLLGAVVEDRILQAGKYAAQLTMQERDDNFDRLEETQQGKLSEVSRIEQTLSITQLIVLA